MIFLWYNNYICLIFGRSSWEPKQRRWSSLWLPGVLALVVTTIVSTLFIGESCSCHCKFAVTMTLYNFMKMHPILVSKCINCSYMCTHCCCVFILGSIGAFWTTASNSQHNGQHNNHYVSTTNFKVVTFGSFLSSRRIISLCQFVPPILYIFGIFTLPSLMTYQVFCRTILRKSGHWCEAIWFKYAL